MFCIRAADFNIRFHNRYELMRDLCSEYLIDDTSCVDIDVPPVSDELLSKRWFIQKDPDQEITDKGQLEYDLVSVHCLYPLLPAKSAFWIHSAAIEMDGTGYALTATSGYGKSTQSINWVNYYSGRARIINGDEPIVRKIGTEYRIYGTPFCGKEGFNINTWVPLHGLCWLEHGDTNKIERIEPSKAFAAFVRDYQHMGSMNASNMSGYMDLLEDFFENVPAYLFTCNLDPDAAKTAYEGMRNGWEAFRKGKSNK